MEKLNIDCLILIFNELRKNNKSLYSCLLVNKKWCHLVVPILWRKYPYFFSSEKSKEKFSNIILSCLPTSSKQLLLDNNIKLPSTILSKSPTFNYVSFCKFLRDVNIDNIINVVFKEEIFNNATNCSEKINLLKQEIYKLFISQCKNIKELECIASQPLPSFPGAQTCFSQLYKLGIDLYYANSNNLYEMSQICKNLSEIFVYNYSQDIPGLISLIDAQKNLKSVSLHGHIKKGTCEEISNALAKKGSTINYLSLCGSVGIISHSFLTSLINLKSLIIHYNFNKSYEAIKKFQEYLENSNFPDLQFLYICNDLSCFKELAVLIEKTRGNILDVSVNISNRYARNTGILLKAISNNCPKIKLLSAQLRFEDLIYLKLLLMNCKNLNKLYLYSLMDENNYIGDELLDILTKFSPKSLNYITISKDWRYSIDAFENFFESYRERKLLYFNVCDIGNSITTEHVNVVKKYFDEGIIANSRLLNDI
jgi:hypothetical protein